jgi:hypothetical protein
MNYTAKLIRSDAIMLVVSCLSIGYATSARAVEGATAPYNEAVKIVNGKRIVEVEPLPKRWRTQIPNLQKPMSSDDDVRSVEIEEGLMDCNSTPFYHPAACVPSNYGTVVRTRAWTVKMNGSWFSCSGRAKPVECIPIATDGKPTDGKLRALAGMRE